MATKQKKRSKKSPPEKPKKAATDLRPEKEEKINLKKLARDERTWKITGAIFILISLFLFISFISYFFTWSDDESQIRNQGISILFDKSVSVKNLLGVLGAATSYFFIKQSFGIASLLICTFFFVVGVNLLFSQKVFSVWRNLRYVIVGVLVICVSMAFVFGNSGFSYGGGVGQMISDWLVRFLGNIGTAALLFIAFLAYVIWQFNPVFKLPKKLQPVGGESNEPGQPEFAITGKTVNDIYAETGKGNSLKGEAKLFIVPSADEQNAGNDLKIVEKDYDEGNKKTFEEPVVTKEVVAEIMHSHDIPADGTIIAKPKTKTAEKLAEELELEIKSHTEQHGEDTGPKEKIYEELPPYEPTLDLRD